MKPILLAAILLSLSGAACRATGPETVPAAQFQAQLQRPGAQLVDVRTPEEFAQGHIPGARLMNVHSPDFESQLNTLDRNRPVLVYCRSGVRSQTAVAVLKRLGFQHIVELQGGITRWNGAIER